LIRFFLIYFSFQQIKLTQSINPKNYKFVCKRVKKRVLALKFESDHTIFVSKKNKAATELLALRSSLHIFAKNTFKKVKNFAFSDRKNIKKYFRDTIRNCPYVRTRPKKIFNFSRLNPVPANGARPMYTDVGSRTRAGSLWQSFKNQLDGLPFFLNYGVPLEILDPPLFAWF